MCVGGGGTLTFACYRGSDYWLKNEFAIFWVSRFCQLFYGYAICVCVCIRVQRRFQQFLSHITTVSGCDRELNAHFYSAASLKYHVPDT